MQQAMCKLVEAQVVPCNDDGGGGGGGQQQFVGAWKRLVDSSSSVGVAVLSPFAVKNTKEEAQRDLLLYPVLESNSSSSSSSSYPCLCTPLTDPNELYPHISCSLRGGNLCMLDTTVTLYTGEVGFLYKYAGDALIAIGALTLILALFGTVIFLLEAGCCWCCFQDVSVSYREAAKDFTPETPL